MEGAPRQETNIVIKGRNSETETVLFGSELTDKSPLRELYTYFSSEDMELIAARLHFDWNEFQGIEYANQFETIKAEVLELAQYKAESDAYGESINQQNTVALRVRFSPIVAALITKLRAI